jgi:hypothetical protein
MGPPKPDGRNRRLLLISVLQFVIRRIVQDRQPVHWREEVLTMRPATEMEAIVAEFGGF